MKKAASVSAFGVLIALLSGCAATPDDTDPTRVEAINNGTVVPEGYLGMVRVFKNGTEEFVNGALLRNDWVITSWSYLLDQARVSVRWNDQTAEVDRVVPYWAPFPGQSPTVSSTPTWAVMLHLATPLTLNGSTQGFVRRLSTAPSMAGRSLYCLGSHDANGVTGALRAGWFTPVAVTTDAQFDLGVNAQGQSAGNDQGSVCFDGSDLAGVYSMQGASAGVQYVSGPTFARTVEAVMNTTAPPSNDSRATAIEIGAHPQGAWESPILGLTTGATHDGPAVSCTCTSGPDIWYRFHVESGALAVYYFDTAGSSYDTSLVITDAAGAPLAGNAISPQAGMCNDDIPCATGGFTSSSQSRTAGVFRSGTYYVVVGGCGTGRVVLNTQRIDIEAGPQHTLSHLSPLTVATSEVPLTGSGTVSGITAGGAGLSTSTCGGNGAEALYWFMSCGDVPLRFSLCPSAGGSYTRRYTNPLTGAYADFDPVLRLRTQAQMKTLACNDDGPIAGATNCVGTGGDSSQYGAHIVSTGVRRGLGVIYVDERTAHSVGALYPLGSTRGMGYTLAYSIR